MTDSIPQTQQDLERQLQEQIQLMELSASAFDSGYDAEAKRLAVSLRVLFHDTHKSHALLGLMNLKNIKFFDSAIDYDPDNFLTQCGLIAIVMSTSPTSQKSTYIAPLDSFEASRVDFDTWWNKIVFVDNMRRTLTRKELILSAADQDGGAHVDPTLDQPYADLSRSNSLAWMSSSTGQNWLPMDDPTRAAIRQIAHEILKSLKPGYVKKPEIKGSAIIMSPTVKLGTSPLPELSPQKTKGIVTNPSSIPYSQKRKKVGRNDPCPCGSGKKYKYCCLR
jgi:hypothetical protein